jgi:hypothetical protein
MLGIVILLSRNTHLTVGQQHHKNKNMSSSSTRRLFLLINKTALFLVQQGHLSACSTTDMSSCSMRAYISAESNTKDRIQMKTVVSMNAPKYRQPHQIPRGHVPIMPGRDFDGGRRREDTMEFVNS